MSRQLPDAPIAVVDLDRSDLSNAALPERSGAPYNGAFIVVREDERPVGIITARADDQGKLVPLHDLHETSEEEDPKAELFCEREVALVSVIICVVDDGASAVRCVRSILDGRYQNFEVIVVNNRPATSKLKQTLAEALGEDPRVRYHEEARPGLAAARNSGAMVARGEVIAFTDDDVVADRNWLASTAEVLSDPAIDCVTGMILPLALETDAQWLLERFAGFGKGFERKRFALADAVDDPLFPFAAGQFGSGANVCLRREAFARLGGFDPLLGTGTNARGGEDLDAFIRLMMEGGALIYEPAAIVWHEHRAEIEDLRQEMFGYGAGLSAVITKHVLGRHRSRLIARIPAGFRLMFDPASTKNARKGDGFPRALTWRERFGALYGPIGYIRSCWAGRGAQKAPVDLIADPARENSHQGKPVFSPILVGEADIAQPLSEISAQPDGQTSRYASARLLIRDHGTPVGFVSVPLENGTASRECLASAIDRLNPEPSAGNPSLSAKPLARPRFSVVICTFDRPDSLLRAVHSVLASEYPDFELLVVDNAPDKPGTRSAVNAIADPRVRYLAEPRAGLSRARNCGLAAADGDLIAFTDDDVEVDEHWLSALADAFAAQDGIGMVTGLIPAAELDNEFQQRFDAAVHWSTELTRRNFDLTSNRLASPTFPFRTGRMGAGANFALTRECAVSVGEFDVALGAGAPCGGGDDLDYFLRVIADGWTLSYEPSALVWHHHRADAESLMRQVSTYGSGATAYAFKHISNPRFLLTFAHSLFTWLTSRRKSSERDLAVARGAAWHRHTNHALPKTELDVKLKREWRRGAWRGPYLYLKGRLNS